MEKGTPLSVIRTAWGVLAAMAVSACATSGSSDRLGSSGDNRPPWIEQLDDETLRVALGPAIDVTPEHGYTPGHFSRTVPDHPEDIWERFQAGLELERTEHERVQREREVFSDRRNHFQTVAERGEPYLHYILERLDERDLPADLVALAMVESAFQPFAYSHGRAAGIWQFIPETGRMLGLEINYWYDGRRDLVASTEAALDYLGRLADAFDGDWLLAMAAYNAGQGNVQAAKQRAEAEGLAPVYWNLELPAETMRYVPRILAVRDILAEPEAYGIELPSIPNEPKVRVVEAQQQVDLALAAELAEIPIEQLYRLNPGYNRWATAPDGPHRFVLPKEAADRFEQALASKDAGELVEWRRHELERGETLTHVAQQYNVTVELLRDINGISADERIRAGEHLYVPISSEPASEYALSAANRLRALQQRERSGVRQEHTVQAGETLWDIAQRYGVEVKELASWNGMAPGDTLSQGQQLVLWTEDGARAVDGSPQDRNQSVTYTVREGDSLAAIAQEFNVEVAQIRRWNEIAEGTYLQPGQQLRLEVDVTQQGHY